MSEDDQQLLDKFLRGDLAEEAAAL